MGKIDATVKVMRGGKIIPADPPALVELYSGLTLLDSQYTDPEGKCSFEGLDAGLYNVIVTWETAVQPQVANLPTNQSIVPVDFLFT